MPVSSLAEKTSLVSSSEYIILKTLLQFRDKFEAVPRSFLARQLNFKPKEMQISLLKLIDLGLINYEKLNGEISYRINFSGLDTIAIKNLYIKNVLKRLGEKIGEGKESVVYYGYNFNDDIIAIKFHRIGKSSYRKARILRGYTERKSWITITLDNAKREFDALKCISDNSGEVPKPIATEYNAVVTEFIEGTLLNNYDLSDPDKVLNSILGTLRIAYSYCGKMVHGDLSPYNILVDNNENIYIIDWPQWKIDDQILLKRDLENILYYFYKKYNIKYDFNKIMEYIRG
jgi:RIO kinase 2